MCMFYEMKSASIISRIISKTRVSDDDARIDVPPLRIIRKIFQSTRGFVRRYTGYVISAGLSFIVNFIIIRIQMEWIIHTRTLPMW